MIIYINLYHRKWTSCNNTEMHRWKWKWKVYLFQANSFLCICVIVPVTLKLTWNYLLMSRHQLIFFLFFFHFFRIQHILSLVIKHIYMCETMFVFLYNFILDIYNFVIVEISMACLIIILYFWTVSLSIIPILFISKKD